VNVGPHLQDGDSLIGVRGLDHLETGLGDHLRRVHSQQKLVFHDENDRSPGRGISHFSTFANAIQAR
jgi:hypothetical protein